MTNIYAILQECHINLALCQLNLGMSNPVSHGGKTSGVVGNNGDDKEQAVLKLKESVVTLTDVLGYARGDKKGKVYYLRARALF